MDDTATPNDPVDQNEDRASTPRSRTWSVVALWMIGALILVPLAGMFAFEPRSRRLLLVTTLFVAVVIAGGMRVLRGRSSGWWCIPCPECDYDLRGLARRGRCPECGTPFDLDAPADATGGDRP